MGKFKTFVRGAFEKAGNFFYEKIATPICNFDEKVDRLIYNHRLKKFAGVCNKCGCKDVEKHSHRAASLCNSDGTDTGMWYLETAHKLEKEGITFDPK